MFFNKLIKKFPLSRYASLAKLRVESIKKIDAKAKVNICEFLRNGKSRDRKAKKAEDHDMNPEIKLVP
ncbi:MAG: hypothetical protein J7K84_01055 [Deltaproteobacteria bacterium]|nr:hypothetical protein [Deltaproteobacteria bacterium]